MAGDINRLVIVGRLTREAESRTSQSGTAILRFSIAVNRRQQVNGQWEDVADFFNCTYVGKGAEAVSQYLEKGRQVAISGSLRQNRWTDSQGQNRSSVEISVENLQLLGSREGQGGNQEACQQAPPQQTRTQAQMYGKPKTQQAPSQYAGKSSAQGYHMAPSPDGMSGPETYSDDDIPF